MTSPEGDPPLLVEVKDDIGILTFNRPAHLNALSSELRRNFIASLTRFATAKNVRVAIVTGAGRAFTAGLDLKEIAASGKSVEDNVRGENVVDAIGAFPKPLIGAINGLAVTGGFEIALALDILILAESASFADTHVRVGIVPGWGLSQRLSRAIGLQRANELSLSGRSIGAQEAIDWGLANRCVSDAELMPSAIDLARQIARNDSTHVARMKELISTGYHGTLGEGLRHEDRVARRDNLDVEAATVGAGFEAAQELARRDRQ